MLQSDMGFICGALEEINVLQFRANFYAVADGILIYIVRMMHQLAVR